MMMRAENFFILRRKPVEVRPMLLVFVITRVLSLGSLGLFDFFAVWGMEPKALHCWASSWTTIPWVCGIVGQGLLLFQS